MDTLYSNTEIQELVNEINPEPEQNYSVKQSPNSVETTKTFEDAEVMSLELAAAHYDGLNNADCRPRLTDSNGNTYLLDSGSLTVVTLISLYDQVSPDISSNNWPVPVGTISCIRPSFVWDLWFS